MAEKDKDKDKEKKALDAKLDKVLVEGAGRAQKIAAETMKAVKDIVGFVHR